MKVDLINNVTVVIRNRNEEEFIGFALQSVCDFLPKAEVIIVDNNSTDDSMEVVKLFNTRLNIRTYNIEDYTPGRALNFAAEKASNKTLLILSAHAQITKLDMKYVQSKLKDNVAVFGNQIPIFRGKKITKRYIWSHFKKGTDVNMYSKIEDRHFLHNAFCFYKKETLLEHPFDEELPGKEDRYWAKSIAQKKKQYYYSDELEVNHYWTKNGATWKGLG